MWKVMIHGIIALMGGIANAIHLKSTSVALFLGNALVASFTGFIFGLVALHFFGEQEYLTTAIAGTGGYMGIEGMNLLIQIFKKSVRANFP